METVLTRLEEIVLWCNLSGLMIEYMLQNSDISMVQTETDNGKANNKKQIYKHYRTLLYNCIREAFIEYLREKWEELRTPVLTVKEWSKEEFCRLMV